MCLLLCIVTGTDSKSRWLCRCWYILEIKAYLYLRMIVSRGNLPLIYSCLQRFGSFAKHQVDDHDYNYSFSSPQWSAVSYPFNRHVCTMCPLQRHQDSCSITDRPRCSHQSKWEQRQIPDRDILWSRKITVLSWKQWKFLNIVEINQNTGFSIIFLKLNFLEYVCN